MHTSNGHSTWYVSCNSHSAWMLHCQSQTYKSLQEIHRASSIQTKASDPQRRSIGCTMMHYASYSFDTCSHGKFLFFFGGDSEFEKDMHCLGVLSCFNFQSFNKLPLQQLVGQKRRWVFKQRTNKTHQ